MPNFGCTLGSALALAVLGGSAVGLGRTVVDCASRALGFGVDPEGLAIEPLALEVDVSREGGE